MKKFAKILIQAMVLSIAAAGVAMATPSTQIWIPSTDVQDFKTFHLGIDNYFRASGVGRATGNPSVRDANVYDIGPVAGFLPFEKLKGEIGFDYLVSGTEPNDNHPWSGNIKLGTPEDSLFKNSPAIAIGGYNLAPSQPQAIAPGITAGQNILYGLVAKTLPAFGSVPSLGRFSVGYYGGSEKALLGPVKSDGSRDAENHGLLASWDRSMTEISDKLWAAVDYQGGKNVDSSVNFGVSWNFAKNVSVIFGYDVYLYKTLAGNNTFTTQLDINFP
ncbi:hypothetical protein [Geomesophilobacter sediminis]|uniref:Uncharacterized protein n=1 Tax=Geomesophilobacter sediminis TaxID=2798584 RepID=A0A8J7LV12_9BACT|nr:hypothetical protein [Geomesophilobacter sediminis]MBJ6724405.1 hypothetical protein [Geomesophilobacter sediminis]